MTRIKTLSMFSLLAGLLLGASLGLSGGRQATAQQPGIEAAIRATMQGAVYAWNQGDVGAFASFLTDKGLKAEFDLTRENVSELSEFLGTPITLRSVQDVKATGDPATATSATAVIELEIGPTVERAQRSFVVEGGRWKIDGTTLLPAIIPAATTAVDVRLVEYGFAYDKNAAGSGNIAFRVQNGGAEPHELVLVKLEADAPALFELIQSSGPDEELQGIEFLAGGGPYEPGQQGTVVFTRALSAGRYGLVCFLSAPDGVPHALKGMVSEFTVGGAGAAGGVRPPSTGNAGLVSSDRVPAGAIYALSAALIALGSCGMLVAGRR